MMRGVAPLTAIALGVLGGSGVVLLALTAEEFLQDDDVSVPKIEWTPKLSTSAERLTSVKPLNSYQQTTAHPIFFKTRQPFVPPPPPAPPPPPPPPPQASPPPPPIVDPGLAVGGVMISGGAKKAYLFRKADRIGSWVAEGEEIMGWKVQSIDSGGATLEKDGRNIELPLYGQAVTDAPLPTGAGHPQAIESRRQEVGTPNIKPTR